MSEVDAVYYLCQNISGFVVGKEYTISFKASRRDYSANPVSATLTIDGDALSKVVTRTNGTLLLQQNHIPLQLHKQRIN